MPPNNPQSPDGFTPRYRNIPPQATIWIKNPFNHDVVFQVADELNRPFQYTLPQGKISELPGGSIATLGLKHLVDEAIQNAKTDVVSMWDLTVRAKYEADIIMREKEAPNTAEASSQMAGPIDLSIGATTPDEKPAPLPQSEVNAADQPETEFPGLASVPLPAPQPVSAPSPLPDMTAGMPATGEAEPNNRTNAE